MIHLHLSAYDQFARVTIETNRAYSVWQVQSLHRDIISKSQNFWHWSYSSYKFEKPWSASYHSHINLAWLCNLRLDYSKTFGGFSCLHVVFMFVEFLIKKFFQIFSAKTGFTLVHDAFVARRVANNLLDQVFVCKVPGHCID